MTMAERVIAIFIGAELLLEMDNNEFDIMVICFETVIE